MVSSKSVNCLLILLGSYLEPLLRQLSRAVVRRGLLVLNHILALGDVRRRWFRLLPWQAALDEAVGPARQDAVLSTPRPRLLLVLVRGDNAAARGLLDDPNQGVDQDVEADASNKTIGD